MLRSTTIAKLLLAYTGFATAQTFSTTPYSYGPGLASRWSDAVSRARALTSMMTLEELNNATYGIDTACSGLTGNVSRLGFDGLCYNDILKSDLVNSYAEGISVGASWNVKLAYERGQFMGAEFRRKGVKVGLTPVVGPLGRVALSGRNMEGFGADPSLAGKLVAASVLGLQENVISTPKHYIANEQETYRTPTGGNNFSVSSNVNDKDMHELYLWPFQDAVAAGAGSVMCSYNRINESYGCENDKILNQLLKDELNFPGFVVSDWGAQHSGVQSASAGLDVAMPKSDGFWNNGTLAKAAQNNTLPRARLEDMVTRQIAASFYVFENATSQPANGHGLVKDYLAPHNLVDARDPASKPSLLQQAIEGHVLVKNIGGALPLKSPKLLSLFGFDGIVQPVLYPSTGVLNYLWTFAAQGVNATLAQLASVLAGAPGQVPQAATLGTLYTATGSGSSLPAYISDPYSAVSQRAYEDDIQLWWNFQSYTPDVSAASSACLIFLNDFSTEGADRAGLADPDSDQLVLHVADRCANTIVIIHNPYIRIVDAFYNHPNVTAIMFAHVPGQDSGRSLVKILFGDVSPSGKLPYTVAKNASDYGPLLNASYTPKASPQSNFSDPSLYDYRYFQANDIEPRFPFGYGLSYTTFTYDPTSFVIKSNIHSSAPTAPSNPSDRIPGGIRSLFEKLVTVSVDVTNSGTYEAAEIVQLYVQYPDEQIHILRSFDKKVIGVNETTTFYLDLTRRDLSRWDVTSQQWLLPNGTTNLMIGSSSQDIKASIQLTR